MTRKECWCRAHGKTDGCFLCGSKGYVEVGDPEPPQQTSLAEAVKADVAEAVPEPAERAERPVPPAGDHGTDETPTRATDPRTSLQAAASVSETTLLRTYRAILLILERGPTTLEVMVQTVEKQRFGSTSGTRTRCSTLVDWGYVEDSGREVAGSTGRGMTVWRITDEGRALLEEMREPCCSTPTLGGRNHAATFHGS